MMVDTLTWIFKFFEIVIVLTCCITQSDGQCSQDTNGFYRFGSECGFICHCLKNEQCNVSTGECPSGCDFEWVGPGCQHNNIALEQHGRHSDNLAKPYELFAPYANDRNLSTCSFTGDENTTGRTVNPFWRVWMPYNFTLRQMEILTLDSKRNYFDGFKVLVEYVPLAHRDHQNYKPDLSQICYTHSNASLESTSLTVTCEHAYTGNHVKIQLGRRNTQLVLCDVRIYGECAENVCTHDCNKLCFCKNVTANDKVSGTCSNGCTGRWTGKHGACDKECAIDKWGATCDTQCGHCRNNAPCDAVTGKCPTSCKDGYKDTQNCDIECDDGTYGQNCQSKCTGHCKNNVTCRKTDGHCPDGCAPGYTGEKCSKLCPVGYFGNKCKERCSTNCAGGHGNCHKAYGTCSAGCNPGWTGRTCQEACPNGHWGLNCANPCINCLQVSVTCRNTDGFCLAGCINGFKDTPFCDKECEDGTYGQQCEQTCNENCNDICNKTDGHCEKCKAGWKGYNCSEECSEGLWGENCLIPCGKCKAGSCDRYNGSCRGSCQPGYKATLYCCEECNIGWYGINCTGQCSPDCKDSSLCRKSDGYCVTEATSSTAAVIGGLGATILVVIILGVLAVIWYLRRTRKGKHVKKGENRANRGIAMSDISSGDRASGVKSTDRISNSYDTVQVGNADEHQYELSD